MGKRKKSFWGENITESTQMETMDDLLRLTRLVESGSPLPNVDFEGEELKDTAFASELEAGLGNALARMMKGNGKPEVDSADEFNPLTRVQPAVAEAPETVPIMESEPVIREMEEVPRDKPAEPPVKMVPLATVTAEDVIPDDEGDDDEDALAYESKDLVLDDFQIVSVDADGDDWIYINIPYSFEHRLGFSTFNLRGYNIEHDGNYELLKKYIPIMMALLAGPALVVMQDDAIFKKFIRTSVERKIPVDKSKFMIFTVENLIDKMYLIYLLDNLSSRVISEGIMAGVVENNQEADLFVQLANTVLNPIINPYGMVETMWPGDRASDEISSDEKVEEFCKVMMTELNMEPVESSKMSYQDAIAKFNKQSVIGDIQKFMAALLKSKESFEQQMVPERYVENFGGTNLEITVDSTADAPSVPEPQKSEESTTAADENPFDGVGESVSEEEPVAEEQPAASVPVEEKPVEVPKKPAKAGSDGKKSRKLEIPVQR